jgi:phage FluMu protein gp41
VLTTEYEFTLPRGYIDKAGAIHKKGKMRLATAADEILLLKDPRVQQNASYLTILVLARVIIKLGTIEPVSATIIENLFTADLAFLQEMYQKINEAAAPQMRVVCPKCAHEFNTPLNFTQTG